MKFALLFLFVSTNLFADISGFEHAPPPFKIGDTQNKHGRMQAVFVDFTSAQYDLVYNAKLGQATAKSTITFIMPQNGYPLFDSLTAPSAIYLNGRETSQQQIYVPGNVSTMRMVQTEIPAGKHTLTIHTEIINGVWFDNIDEDEDEDSKRSNLWGDVSSGFFIRDLKDRKFLEKYLPTNYEYDQYKMDFDVKVTGTKRWHSLFANGKTTKISENHYKVSMPDWYCASSVYFHLVPINRFVRWYLTYPSIDGRKIPVTIYSSYRFYNHYVKQKAWGVISELEADYGPYPHDQLIIYGTGITGGMEHSGATESSIVSLGHELQHMYFAKAIHPANGNSGWLDEAIASWRDKGHQSHETPDYESINLAKHNQYTRKTDKRSYVYGRSFMAYLDYQLKVAGRKGLKHFLKIYFNKRKYTNVTTEDFKADIEEYAQMSFADDFFQYIYGGNGDLQTKSLEIPENPHHPEVTEEDLKHLVLGNR